MKKEKCMMKVKETMKEKWKKRIITKNMKNKISLMKLIIMIKIKKMIQKKIKVKITNKKL